MNNLNLKHLTIDPDIIKEFPRFFTGGIASVSKEILQNCYRSGASEVTIQYDQDSGNLKIMDNGSGCEIDAILSAGYSGWKNESFDPAGLGIFSYFSIAKKIIMISYGKHNWKTELDNQHLNHNKEVIIEESEYCIEKSGFTLQLFLEIKENKSYPSQESIKSSFAKSRAYYPFKLYWDNGNDILEELVYSTWEPSLVIESQIGEIHIEKGVHIKDHSIVHQYVPIRSEILRQTLETYCSHHPEGELLSFFMSNVNFRLFPTIEVKPKLPDRNEFDSAAIEQIVPQIATAILCEVDTLLPISKTWPDIIEYREYSKLLNGSKFDVFNHCYCRYLKDSLLCHFGYTRIDFVEINEPMSCYEEDNDLRLDQHLKIVFLRNQNIFESPNEAVVLTINNLGYFCKLNKQASPIMILKGIQIPDDNKHLGFVEEIWIEGIGNIPYLCTAGRELKDYPEIQNVSVLINSKLATPEYLKENETLFINMVCLGIEEYEGSYYEYQRTRYGEVDLDTTKINSELWVDYYRNNPALLADIVNQYDIEFALFELNNIYDKISLMKTKPAIEKLFPSLTNNLLEIVNQSREQIQAA